MIRRTALGALGAAVLLATPAAGAADGQPLSHDPFLNPSGQHETAVEPDSLSFGDTIVASFQLGRMVDGGASGNGWATSTDGGTTWRNGVLPALTSHQSPPGPYSRVSDPTVAYDRAHGVWLAAGLALRDTPRDRLSSVIVSRSSDGLSWSSPVVAAAETDRFAHDKPWIVCDTGASSPHFGRCYATWTTRPGANGVLALASSSDGGMTWNSATVVEHARGSGWQPLVRPNGTLVVVYEGARTIEAVLSFDGGRSFSPPATVGALRAAPVPGVRAPALPSAEIDAAGRVWAVWHDCRFRAGCPSRSAVNDLVVASSADGVRWSRVRRIPTQPELDGLTHFVPGLAVDASTRGDTARLAVAFYVLTPRCAGDACRVAPMLVSSSDAGRTWSAPESLAPPQPLTSFPQSNAGRFLGDYISTSFAGGGNAVPVFAAASGPPAEGRFRQAIFAARVAPLASRGPFLRLGATTVTPRRPRAGQRVTVRAPVSGTSARANVNCFWGGRRVRLTRATARFIRGRATCTWLVRSAGDGARVEGFMEVVSPEEEATRRFAFRVRA